MSVLGRSPSIPDISSSAMMSPTRSPRIGYLASPSLGVSDRHTYSSSAASLYSYSHNRSLRSDLPRYSSLPDTPRSVLLNEYSMPTSSSKHSHGNFQIEQSLPFNSQENYVDITCEGSTVAANIEVKANKGFFYSSDHAWTCYRRNYFSVTVSFGLTPWPQNGRLYLNRGGQPQEQVMSMAVSLNASVIDSGGKPIELIQHTPKRDKGPQLPIKKELLSPTPPPGKFHDHKGYYFHSVPQNSTISGPQLPLQNESEESHSYSPASRSNNNYQHSFERIQFKSATANNGKRRAQQQYFNVIVELWANVQAQGGSEPQWVMVAARSSLPIVVRGRSPSHYPLTTGRVCQSPMPRHQGLDLNGERSYTGHYSQLGIDGFAIGGGSSRGITYSLGIGEPKQHNIEQLDKQERHRESTEKLAGAGEIPKVIKKPHYLSLKNSDAKLPIPSIHLNAGPIQNTQSSSNQSQKLFGTLTTPIKKEGTRLQDVLGTNTKTENAKHAIASPDSEKLLLSTDRMREIIEHALEPSKLVSPIPLPRTDNILTVDLSSDVQSVGDIDEHDGSKRPMPEISSPKPSPAVVELLTHPNYPTPDLEPNNSICGTSPSAKSVEMSKNEETLASPTQPKHMGQSEVPSLQAQLSTGSTVSVTGDDSQSFQAMDDPENNALQFSKPDKSDTTELSSIADSLLNRDKSISPLEIPGDGSAGDANEEELNVIEMDRENDEASGCEISVRRALDIAVMVVKGLILRELLDYTLPEAMDAEECAISVHSVLDTTMSLLKLLLRGEFQNYVFPGAIDTVEGSDSPSPSSHSGSANRSVSSGLSSFTSNSQAPNKRKRMRGDGGDPGDDSGDDSNDDDDRPKKKSKADAPDRLPIRRLKCPFYQRQPEKYKKAACRGEGFADMAKLKDHIKRVHTQPLRCSRCWLEMTSEDIYSEHLQRIKICEIKAEPEDDRIRRQLLNQLDFKKAPYANAKSVEEKWSILFSVLFPNDSNIPSPYEQHGLSPRLEQALSEALEEKLTRELAPFLEPMISRIKELIPSIIESCRLKLTSTSPSGIEPVSAPPTASSDMNSSDSKPRSSDVLEKRRSNIMQGRCSTSSFDVVPSLQVLSAKAKQMPLQHSVPSTSTVRVEGRQEILSPESSSDFIASYFDAPDQMQSPCGNNSNDSTDIGVNHKLFALSSHLLPNANDSSVAPATSYGIALETCDFTEDLSQQCNTYCSGSRSSTCTLSEAGWDREIGKCGQYGNGQLSSTIPREQNLPPEWDLLIKDFDISYLPNG